MHVRSAVVPAFLFSFAAGATSPSKRQACVRVSLLLSLVFSILVLLSMLLLQPYAPFRRYGGNITMSEALNIRQLLETSINLSRPISVCGEEKKGPSSFSAQPLATRQEISSVGLCQNEVDT